MSNDKFGCMEGRPCMSTKTTCGDIIINKVAGSGPHRSQCLRQIKQINISASISIAVAYIRHIFFIKNNQSNWTKYTKPPTTWRHSKAINAGKTWGCKTWHSAWNFLSKHLPNSKLLRDEWPRNKKQWLKS